MTRISDLEFFLVTYDFILEVSNFLSIVQELRMVGEIKMLVILNNFQLCTQQQRQRVQ